MGSTVLIIGVGDMASRIAPGLAAAAQVSEIVLASRNRERGENLAVLTASSHPCRARFVELDGTEQAAVEALIAAAEPDLILQNASLIGPFVLVGRDDPIAAAFKTGGLGPLLPAQLPVLLTVMRAARRVGYPGPIANLSLPDITNEIMHKVGLAPTLGLGNVGMMQLRVRGALLARGDVEIDSLPLIRMIAQHSQTPIVMQSSMPEDPADRVRVYLGEEGTRADELAYALPGLEPGVQFNVVTAAACLAPLLALLPGSAPLRVSLPGPLGLPGGYPVRIRDREVSLDLPPGVELPEVIAYQNRMARNDGIERIGDDGTVTFTDEVVSAVSSVDPELCAPLPLDDLWRRYEILRDALLPTQ